MTDAHEPPRTIQTHSAVDVLRTDTAGLRCPACTYDLTGLSESRCPECGQTFDAAALRSGIRPATPWDTPGERFGFLRTLWMSLFHVRRLVAAFPDRHSRGAALRFSLLCYAVAWTLLILTVPAALGPPTSVSALVIFGSLVAAMICEVFVGGRVGAILHFDQRQRPAFWSGVNKYLSGYLIVTSLAVALALNRGPIMELCRLPAACDAFLANAPAIPVTWWYAAQLIAARTRGATLSEVLLFAATIPIAVAFSIVLGACAVGFCCAAPLAGGW